MIWDDRTEEESKPLSDKWLRILDYSHPCLAMRLAAKHRPGHKPREASGLVTRWFSICSTVTFDDGFRAVVRFPMMGRSQSRIDQTANELLVMGYLAPRIQSPLPEILGAGRRRHGPYFVTALVDGVPLSSCLRDPSSQTPGLRPDVSDDADLGRAYRVMANILLDVYKLQFPLIGALTYVPGEWQISSGPLPLAMYEVARVGNRSFNTFMVARQSFRTAGEFFDEVAYLHLLHLQQQKDEVVADAEDVRKKYVARCLFRRIVREEIRTERAPFRLYCDRLSPSSVLVASETDFTVRAVTDWVLTHSAPAEYSHAAPWWLLFEGPEAWEHDLHGFLDRYRPRLALFLQVLEVCEEERRLASSDRLSARMAQSLDNGIFWLCLAARRRHMFDNIYWNFLDTKFFGAFETLDQRISFLSEQERDNMEGFVQEMLRQREEPRPDEQTAQGETTDL